jgi:hypothetical protein
MKKDLSAQNVVLMQSAEDPDDFADWGAAGFDIPPVGTYKTGTQTKTLDNSATEADNTPGEPTMEVLKGKASLGFPTDEDDKESMDVSTTVVEHDPGKEKLDLSLDAYEERGTNRLVTARMFNPLTREYRRSPDYPRFNVLVISYPKDSSGFLIPVTAEIDKSTILSAEAVRYWRDVIWKSKSPVVEQGDKVRSSLAGHAEQKREWNNYAFNALIKGAITIDTTPTATTFTSAEQPKIPTRIALAWTETVGGDIILTGKNARGETITETITVSGGAPTTYYTDKVFGELTSIVGDGTANGTAAINAAELY